MVSKLVATILGVALVVLLAGTDSAAMERRFGDLPAASAAVNVEGVWTLEFCWEGSPCGRETMGVRQVAVFIAVDVNSAPAEVDAVGIVVGPMFFAQFLSGCRPLYRSANATETSMSGTMRCQKGYPFMGTWSAVKGAEGGAFSPNGIPADGGRVQ